MSHALFNTGGLRFWNSREIMIREHAIGALAETVKRSLLVLNQGWMVERVETPVIMPIKDMSSAYDPLDFFTVEPGLGGDGRSALRAETTLGTYLMAVKMLKDGYCKPPLCVWQAGHSFRTETSDGATAEKLRFNQFWQLEFQCIYRADSKADYVTPTRVEVASTIQHITGLQTRMIPSDRLPAYATETVDIEVYYNERWTEMASTSRRTDFPVINPTGPELTVFEVAVGLDRLVAARLGRA
jgi:glycyl-tRNA synthetase